MQIKETVVVERELHVAPCIECGHEDIHLSDSNYSSFNVGGGKCKNCNHQSTRSEEHTSELQSLMRISYAVFCLKKKKKKDKKDTNTDYKKSKNTNYQHTE